jgi:hypothetical protein
MLFAPAGEWIERGLHLPKCPPLSKGRCDRGGHPVASDAALIVTHSDGFAGHVAGHTMS